MLIRYIGERLRFIRRYVYKSNHMTKRHLVVGGANFINCSYNICQDWAMRGTIDNTNFPKAARVGLKITLHNQFVP
ncbi:hypothetical protein PAECIP111802_05064 [Paenibacillus allorhizosphaerae]|uniref:Transposase n=1 Tax=Paenibacillus allorhizosphaerae TaxID=2849866 RepID=A0ABM8VNT7_9BACL|nr:hypothetical protein PAECIP111802_05064 [Paenibacillus allorhizosphaerae]